MKQIRPLTLLAATVLAVVLPSLFLPAARAAVTTVSYWRMGENDPGVASGTATNTIDPVGFRTLTLRGAPTYNSSVPPAAATTTGSTWSMLFGTGSYGTNAVIPSLTDNFGLELWVKPNDTTGNKCLVYNGDTGTGGWGLYQVGATYQGLLGGVVFTGSGTAISGTWAHVALVRNNGTNFLYVNGIVAGATTTPGPNPAVGLFGVGAAAPNISIDRFIGNLDEVRVFTFAAGAFTTNDLLLTAQPPAVTTLAATGLSSTNATLNGTVDPFGRATTAYFQYGLTTSYGLFSGTNILTATNTPLAVSKLISNLPPNTLYHFRIVATNSAGSSLGSDLTFTTTAVSTPTATTLAATSVGATNTTLNATVNPGGSATTVYFQYGLDTNLSSSSGTIPNPSFESNSYIGFPGYASGNGGIINGWTISNISWIGLNPASGNPFADNGAIPAGANVAFIQSNAETNTLSTTISNLIVGRSYQVSFRANCRSGYGPFTSTWSLNGGSFVPFTASPEVGGTNAYYTNSGSFTATNTTAALALRNFSSGDTTVLLDDFSIFPTQSGFSATNILAGTNTSLAVSNLITGLLPVTTYYYQVVASNSAGLVTGAPVAFTTGVLAPAVTTLAATGIGATNVTLNGTVNPGSGATTAYFQYGTATNYGSFSATNNLAATNITLAVSNLISGLSAGTLYHFRIVAVNGGGNAFGPDLTFTTVAPAGVTTLAATGITATNAILNGTVNPGDGATTAYFQYGANTNYGSFSATNNLAATNGTLAVSNLIGNLSPATLYHFRIVANNSAGSTFGQDVTFTSVAVPTVTTLPATGIGATNATLNAAVNPGNGVTEVYFQYGTDTNFDNSTGTIPNPSFEANSYATSPGYANVNGGTINGWTISNPSRIGLNPASGNPFANNGAIPTGTNVAFIQSNSEINTLSTTISNLVVGKTYQVSFRANCRSGFGPFTSTWSLNGGSFAPFTASPSVGGTNAYYTNSATFTATASTAALVLQNFSSGDTTVLLDAFSILSIPYGSFSATNILAAATTDLAVSNFVTGLLPGAKYYFHVVANNSAGTVTGADLTFTTSLAVPIITTLPASAITTNSAAFSGTVNPSGSATTAYFRYGTDTNYGSFSTTNILAAENNFLTIFNLVSNLSPATLYHFQLVASNIAGSTAGADQTFTTVRLPMVMNITNTGDSGPGTLRQAILDSIPDDTIFFDAGLSNSPILLTSGQLLLTNNLTISAAALPGGLQINGNGGGRLFQVDSSATVVLTALTLTNGGGVTSGGGIYNSGILTLNRCTLAGNSVIGVAGGVGGTSATGGTGGTSFGGALYNAGTLTLNQCTLAGNLAKGGTGGRGGTGFNAAGFSSNNGGRGGDGGTGGTGTGGAIYNAGILAVNQCTLSANTSSGGNGGSGGPGGNHGGFGGSNGSPGNTGGVGSATAGGIYQSSTLTLFNSIVAGNTPDNIVGSFTSTGNNLTSGNPLLSGLGNNGGPTPTMVLLAGSPAFDAGASTTFTTDQRGLVRVMGAAPDIGAVEMTVPNVSTLAAANVTSTTATLNGTINPNSVAATVFFQYGTTTNYGSYSSTNALPTTNVNLAVVNSIANLQPATTYHFRIVASSSIGLVIGSDLTFTTGAAAPTATTLAATGITSASATLNSTVNPNGLTTAAYFEFGLTTGYGLSTATNSLIATNTALGSANLISSLSPGTLYHFRIVAINSSGSALGSDLTFTTAPLVPVVTTLAATAVSPSNATLNATVNPGSGSTTAYFKYGPTTGYGSFSATNNLTATSSTLAVSTLISNLPPGSLFHFQVVAVNSAGSASGSDQTFTTLGAAPTVTTVAATGIGATNATLRSTINPNGLATAAYFQYGTDTNYGTFSATNNLAATNTSFAVSNLVSNLLPGTLYHFRSVAINSAGSALGQDLTFTTSLAAPKVTTLAATGINATSVTLNGMVNPGNAPTMAYFQYSLETNYPGGTIANPSFETNHYTVSPGYASGNGTIITGWTISKTTRIGLNPANGSPFADNGATPDGANVAFIQSNADTNTLSTTISNLIVDKSYLVSFRANCRTGLAATNSTWSLNGGSFVPFTSSPAVGGTNTYYTNSAVFIATNSTAALALRNSTPVDTTVLLDAFSMVSTAANFSPSINVAATNADVAVSYVITGLQPATTYYFQIAASNSVGRATGAELSFTTGATDPTVTTLAATGVSATSATLNATVNPNGSVIAAYFEYGTTTNYGLSSATNNLAITNITLAVSNLVSSLSPATLYHFRIVANNDSGGSMPGSDQTLTTSMAAPTIIPLVATLLNTNAATGLRSIQLSALVDPNGSTTTSYIEYGLTTAYAATNPFPSLSASIVETNLTAIVSFSAGFTYHWRIVAANSLGTTTSPDQTFILGTLSPPGGGLAGDLNGDGFVSQAELDAVYGNYVTNSPWLYMTNVSGLGGTNVSFALDNPASGAYTVQYSTNLVDWLPLGPATPRYLFTDTNAPALPQRYYRLSYP